VKKTTFKIPLSKPDLSSQAHIYVNEVLSSDVLSMGPFIDQFEAEFSKQLQVSYSVAVSSGTAALHLAMILAGIKEGDEVIASPFSFIASSNSILYQSAKPVFIDIEEETLGMNPAAIEGAINANTRAILPTHVFGQACRIDEIADLATKHGLLLIEDNCESPGSTRNNQLAGSFGQFAAYGFYPNKPITTGEGGMLTTNTDEMGKRAKSLRNQGRSDLFKDVLLHDELGYNYRLSEINAAIGFAQVQELNHSITKRRAVAAQYNHLLSDIPEVQIPFVAAGSTHVWFVYAIRVDSRRRDAVIKSLLSKGIQCRAYFSPCIHLQPFYKQKFGFKEGDFPMAEKVSKETIALPIYQQMTESEIVQVVEALKESLLETS
jgi:perosamine synthetase